MPIDSSYFDNHFKTSYWQLAKQDADGWIGCIVFKGDSLDVMMLNFAKGGGADRCTYSYRLQDNYVRIKIGECDEDSRKATFWVYWTDEKTMHIGVPTKKTYNDPRKIPVKDWGTFIWMDPASLEENTSNNKDE